MHMENEPQSVADLVTMILSIAALPERTMEAEHEITGMLAQLDCSSCQTIADAVGLFDLSAVLYRLALEKMKEQEFLANACFEAADRYQGLAKAFLSGSREDVDRLVPVLH